MVTGVQMCLCSCLTLSCCTCECCLCAIVLAVPGSEVAMHVSADTSFKSLESAVCDSTLKAVADMGFTHMTEIQSRTIPPLLEGR